MQRIKPVSAAYHHKVKERAKACSAAITLTGQDIASLTEFADSACCAQAERDFNFFYETFFASSLFTVGKAANQPARQVARPEGSPPGCAWLALSNSR
jgi:hypothetical protein